MITNFMIQKMMNERNEERFDDLKVSDIVQSVGSNFFSLSPLTTAPASTGGVNPDDDDERVVELPVIVNTMLSCVSSVFGALSVYPLDKVKTKIQSQRKRYPFIATVKSIYHLEGIRGFYKGLTAILVGIAPEKTLKLTVNAWSREKMRRPDQKHLDSWQEAVCGVITGLTQVTISTPYEFVKIRCQLAKGKEQLSPLQVIRENKLGIYKGYSATMMRDIPFNIIYFTLYNKIKLQFGPHPKSHEVLISSATAGAVAAFLDTPADFIKTRLQNGRVPYKGIYDCFQQTAKKEGISALFKGAPLRVGVIAPLFGVTFMVFESLKEMWRQNFPEQHM
eukprot:TRINITY_DN496_c0_g1_i1.p1 TRINITY_DN496_c0_g1~~TRINITY_DN496_c0_g1_i1.p1  ORF type:complete len:335 (-),score=67.93 TRINITY_DN496_c0_g1_i1:269-1273(-)